MHPYRDPPPRETPSARPVEELAIYGLLAGLGAILAVSHALIGVALIACGVLGLRGWLRR